MNNIQTIGILSVLFLAGAGIASAVPMGGAMGQMGQKMGMKNCLDAEDKEAIHKALLALDYEMFSSLIADCPMCKSITEEQFLERAKKVRQREAVHEAVLAGDWGTYSSLVEEYGLTEGIHGVMTKEAFQLFSELANLKQQQMQLRQQLADELGIEPGMGNRMAQRMGQSYLGPGFGKGTGI